MKINVFLHLWQTKNNILQLQYCWQIQK